MFLCTQSLAPRLWTVVLSSIVFVGACGAASAREMRAALVEECPTTNYPTDAQPSLESVGGTILSGLLGSLAGTLVDAGVKAVKDKVNPGNKDIGAQSLHEGLYVYTSKNDGDKAGVIGLSPKLGCLVVAVGDFVEAAGTPSSEISFPFKSQRDTLVASNLFKTAIGLETSPRLAFYFEATLRVSSDRTALTWQPVRFYVDDYLDDSFFAGRSRGMHIDMRLYKPGIKDAFYTQQFKFGLVRKPVSLGPSELFKANSGTWGLLPAPPERLPERLSPTKTGRPFSPFTIDIQLVETPKPYELAQAFATAVEVTKEPLKQGVVGLLDNNAKRKAELTADAPTITAVTNYLEAFTEAKKVCSTAGVSTPEGRFGCRIALDTAAAAKLNADLACRASKITSCEGMPDLKEAGGA